MFYSSKNFESVIPFKNIINSLLIPFINIFFVVNKGNDSYKLKDIFLENKE